MTVQQSIIDKIKAQFSLVHLEVVNESHMHNVPANSETHFKVVLVSDDFDGQRLIQRQRAINKLLAEELAGPVHALAQHIYTQAEWEKKFAVAPDSPNCLGGSKS
ncbi:MULTISPECIES: BolA/IbaG family iron-sulfur metabolism protein [Alteromonadaceae]|jgi:BolA protein|uniref:DNA-binding transcriptional regulator BolA n=1 Tax=Brumicola blandensis TaxID=3075611 RepID=A0AAW8R429_9ALTE|nr:MULTISPECIES: BolA/IbaG family iron-sulfur metabolism protein [unclassified Alteromonas]MDT0583102.1 BolA/IbaG family iron-sulfur metabolism protein [Alteromonas sp. W409]MDT0627407.1 BolA/IbaG family iron-sulfur metabolism protein [Alteromonas sp. W364]